MLRKGIALAALGLAFIAGPALAADSHRHPKPLTLGVEGPLGRYDQVQLQRGFKVYREVCSACHSMNLMYFRNLGQKGGPFYDAKYKNPNDNPYVKAIAGDYQISDIDSETGDVVQRPGTSADRFPNPFPNEAAARASNGGALPPDLSVIAKGRAGGAAYVYSLLSGYPAAPPEGLHVDPGKYYNPYFPGDLTSAWKGQGHAPEGGVIAMAPPLAPGLVAFDDGTPSTVDQQAKDVTAFLAWAAEPKLEERKQFGLGAMIYLLIFSGLLWASYRRIWRNVAH